MTRPDTAALLDEIESLPRDDTGPVFQEPWQAQAFALTLALHEAGAFSWAEWATALSQEITRAQQAGDPDLGDTYYLHWLTALETLAAEKGIAGLSHLAARKEAWRQAYLATPHGSPVSL